MLVPHAHRYNNKYVRQQLFNTEQLPSNRSQGASRAQRKPM